MMKKCLRALSCGKKKKKNDDEYKGTPGNQRMTRGRRSMSPMVTSPRYRYTPTGERTGIAPQVVRSMSPQQMGGEGQRLLAAPPAQMYGEKGRMGSVANRSASIKSMNTATSIHTSQTYRTGSVGTISTLPSRRSASRTPLVTPAFPTSSPYETDRGQSQGTVFRDPSPVDRQSVAPSQIRNSTTPAVGTAPAPTPTPAVQHVEFVDVLDELVKRRAAEPHRFIIEEDCSVIKSVGTKGAPGPPPQHLGTVKSQVMPVPQRSPPRNTEPSPIWNTGISLSVHSVSPTGSEQGCPSTHLPMTSVFAVSGRSSTVCSETKEEVGAASARPQQSAARQQSVWSDKKIPAPHPNDAHLSNANNNTTSTKRLSEARSRQSVGVPEQLAAAWNGPTVWREDISPSPEDQKGGTSPPFAASQISSTVSLAESAGTQRPSIAPAQGGYEPIHKDTSTSISPARVVTLLLDHGDEYQGTVKNGIPHGSGTMRYTNGNSYSGELRDGLKWGNGIFRWRNGDFYEGEFENDVFQGNGSFVFANSSVSYTGAFKNGMFCGDMPEVDNLDRTAPAQAPSPGTLRSSTPQDQNPNVVQLNLSAPDADGLCPQWPALSWEQNERHEVSAPSTRGSRSIFNTLIEGEDRRM